MRNELRDYKRVHLRTQLQHKSKDCNKEEKFAIEKRDESEG